MQMYIPDFNIKSIQIPLSFNIEKFSIGFSKKNTKINPTRDAACERYIHKTETSV